MLNLIMKQTSSSRESYLFNARHSLYPQQATTLQSSRHVLENSYRYLNTQGLLTKEVDMHHLRGIYSFDALFLLYNRNKSTIQSIDFKKCVWPNPEVSCMEGSEASFLWDRMSAWLVPSISMNDATAPVHQGDHHAHMVCYFYSWQILNTITEKKTHLTGKIVFCIS